MGLVGLDTIYAGAGRNRREGAWFPTPIMTYGAELALCEVLNKYKDSVEFVEISAPQPKP